MNSSVSSFPVPEATRRRGAAPGDTKSAQPAQATHSKAIPDHLAPRQPPNCLRTHLNRSAAGNPAPPPGQAETARRPANTKAAAVPLDGIDEALAEVIAGLECSGEERAEVVQKVALEAAFVASRSPAQRLSFSLRCLIGTCPPLLAHERHSMPFETSHALVYAAHLAGLVTAEQLQNYPCLKQVDLAGIAGQIESLAGWAALNREAATIAAFMGARKVSRDASASVDCDRPNIISCLERAPIRRVALYALVDGESLIFFDRSKRSIVANDWQEYKAHVNATLQQERTAFRFSEPAWLKSTAEPS